MQIDDKTAAALQIETKELLIHPIFGLPHSLPHRE